MFLGLIHTCELSLSVNFFSCFLKTYKLKNYYVGEQCSVTNWSELNVLIRLLLREGGTEAGCLPHMVSKDPSFHLFYGVNK